MMMSYRGGDDPHWRQRAKVRSMVSRHELIQEASFTKVKVTSTLGYRVKLFVIPGWLRPCEMVPRACSAPAARPLMWRGSQELIRRAA